VITEQITDNIVAHDEMIVIGLGSVHRSTTLRIVDPDTKQVLPAGRVGELWLSNPCVSKGYWNKEDLTKEIFGAFTSDTNEGPFLRTGDLAFVMPTGEMFFTSRLKVVG
jgi:acyl-CoA synthetase (AMP-forming)/AMP-acid ligase II